MLRIAIVQPCIPHYRDAFFSLLADHGNQVTVFADAPREGLRQSLERRNYDVEYGQIDQISKRTSICWQSAMLRCLDKRKFDVAVLTWDAHYLSLLPAILKGWTKGIPVVLWGHGYSKRPQFYRDWIRNQFGKAASGVLLYDAVTRERLIAEVGFQPERVFVAPNALDQDPIQQEIVRYRDSLMLDGLIAFRQEHRIEKERNFLFVSRLHIDNRLDLAIRALNEIDDGFGTVTLSIVGDGPDRVRLEQLACELGVSDRLRWAGAVYEEEQLAKWFLSSHAFVYPLNVGLSLLHAFGYGLPVLTSDHRVAQNPEIAALRHGWNGILFDKCNVDSLAHSMKQLLLDDQLHARLSANARSSVLEEFSLENMVRGFTDAVNAVARRG